MILDQFADTLATRADQQPGPSNSRGLTPIIEDPPSALGVGIDTIRVFGPVHSWRLTMEVVHRWVHLKTGEVREVESGGWVVLPSGYLLRVSLRRNQYYASMEYSVPTLISGHNREPSGVLPIFETLAAMYEHAADYVTWACSPEALGLSRVDLVRDFTDVTDAGILLDGLHRVPCPAAKDTHRYASAARGNAQTLARGVPGRWRACLYEKGPQLVSLAHRAAADQTRADMLMAQAEAARDQLRFEVSIRRPVLRDKAMRTVEALQDSQLDAIRAELFRRARFDQPVAGPLGIDRAVRSLLDDLDHRRVAPAVIGNTLITALGLPSPTSPNTLVNHRRIARVHGLSAGDFAMTPMNPIALDYQLGRLVAA